MNIISVVSLAAVLLIPVARFAKRICVKCLGAAEVLCR